VGLNRGGARIPADECCRDRLLLVPDEPAGGLSDQLRSNFADFFLLVFVGAIFPLQIAIAETIMGWLGVREVDEKTWAN